jgi:hypothetical protein
MGLSTEAKMMKNALCTIVVPYLRNDGYKGTFPHFRRQREDRVDLLSFQFLTLGGGRYTINLNVCSHQEIVNSSSLSDTPNRVTANHFFGGERLSKEDFVSDHWFVFGGNSGMPLAPGARSNIFETYCQDPTQPFESLANATLLLIKERADSVLEKVFHKRLTAINLSVQQWEELELLACKIPIHPHTKKQLDSEERKRLYISSYIGDYLSGKLQAQDKAFSTLTQEQKEKLLLKIRVVYPLFDYNRSPHILEEIAYYKAAKFLKGTF